MTLRSTLSIVALAFSSFAVGCASPTAQAPSSSGSQVMVSGNVGGGSVATKSFDGVTGAPAGGALHVYAHEVHARGEAGGIVDAVVNADGSFHVNVERGKRWLITVDDGGQGSAIVTFANGENVLRVAADGANANVTVGDLTLLGGEALATATLDASLGVDAALAGLDDVFEAANGAIITAREAADEARKAADEARKAAADAQADAQKAAADAQAAAEAARKAAGQ